MVDGNLSPLQTNFFRTVNSFRIATWICMIWWALRNIFSFLQQYPFTRDFAVAQSPLVATLHSNNCMTNFLHRERVDCPFPATHPPPVDGSVKPTSVACGSLQCFHYDWLRKEQCFHNKFTCPWQLLICPVVMVLTIIVFLVQPFSLIRKNLKFSQINSIIVRQLSSR